MAYMAVIRGMVTADASEEQVAMLEAGDTVGE